MNDHSDISRFLQVVESAAKAEAVVKSLFPSTVRDRLYEETKRKNPKTRNEWANKSSSVLVETNKNKLRKLVSRGDEASGGAISAPDMTIEQSDSIADFFPSCTILFAGKELSIGFYACSRTDLIPSSSFSSNLLPDIAGFTGKC